MSVTDFLAELSADPAYVAGEERLKQDMAQEDRSLQEAETPLLRDLERAGVRVSTTWDLIEWRPGPQRSRVAEILLDHLGRPYPAPVREGIARALTTVGRSSDWPRIERAYKEEREAQVKDGLATALVATAGRIHQTTLVDLALDERNGASRVLLLGALPSVPGGVDALRALLDDPEVGGEATYVLGRTRRRTAAADAAESSSGADVGTISPSALVEVVSVSLDVPDLRAFVLELGAALALGDRCVSSVIEGLLSVEPDATSVVDCRSEGRIVRFETFGDDREQPDLYVFAEPDAANTIRTQVDSILDRLKG